MRLELRRGRQRGKMARADEDTDDVSSVSAGSGIGAGSQPPSPSSVARVTHASDGSPIETLSASPSSRGTTHRAGSTFAQGHRWGPATPASSSTPRELDAHGSSAGASSGADDESRSHEALLSPMRARLRRSKSSPSANEPTRGSSGTGAFDDSLILSDEPPSPPRPDMDDGTADGGTSNSRGVLSTLMAVLYEIAAYWIGFVTTLLLPGWMRRATDNRRLNAATTYNEWKTVAAEIDERNGAARRWKLQFESPHYDYVLVHERLKDLQKARHLNDWARSAYLMRSSLDRNLGGIGSPKLFETCMLGTKELIESYLFEVEYHLNYLADHDVEGLTHKQKVDMFVHVRQGFGRSALLLSGGAGLGVHHFGVIKVLWQQGLMPRVISGSSAGALVGALICTTADAGLERMLTGTTPHFKNHHLITRAGEGDAPRLLNMLFSLGTRGVLADVDVLKECCRENFGDMTFQEAYDKTRRILNITVNSRAAHGRPRLLNYLTSPDVVIWSASVASCALSGLFEEVEIVCKDRSGRLRPWGGPPGTKWSDGSIESDLPMERLRELFNVNHFIVSQVNPHVVPLLASDRPHIEPRFPWLVSLLLSEAKYRLKQLLWLGVFPATSRQLFGLLSQDYTGDVTIVPHISHRAYIDILSNPTPPIVARAVLGGERAAWARLPIIKSHCRIEITLEKIVERLRGVELWTLN